MSYMMRSVLSSAVLIALCVVPGAQGAQRSPEPEKVTLCQLTQDPAAYNHKLVEVTAFVSHGFEDFTLFDPNCPSAQFRVWLEYGGTAASGTIYCCGGTAKRSRPKQLRVENVPIPLVSDKRFREFDRLLQHPPDSVAHATIVGRFFAGNASAPQSPGGYGHLGCCSLLAIQQVLSVDPHDRDDLDYGASVDAPEEECDYKYLIPNGSEGDLTDAQRKAEAGQRDWSFSNPQRVASDFLARSLNMDEAAITGLKLTREAQGRKVYQWHPEDGRLSYMIVVNRPYWLSFSAKDAKKVAWVAAAAYEISCPVKTPGQAGRE
jgi:hypothetical protein